MGKKRDKFKYDPEDYKDEFNLKDRFPSEPKPTFKVLSCPQSHKLDDRNWSHVRQTYYCPGCLKEVKKSDTILV